MSKVGRPVGWRKEKSEIRPQHQVRAYPDEWQIIKAFADIVKKGDKSAAIEAIRNIRGKGEEVRGKG